MKQIVRFLSRIFLSLSVMLCLLQPAYAYDSACEPSSFDGAFMLFTFECFNDQVMIVPDSQLQKKDPHGWQYIKDNKYKSHLPDNDGLTNGGILDPSPDESDFEIYGVAFKETRTQVFIAIWSEIGINGSNLSDAEDGHIGWGDILIAFDPSNGNFTHQSNQSTQNIPSSKKLYGIHFVPNTVTSDSNANYKGVYKDVQATSVAQQNKGFASLYNYMIQVQHQGGTVGLGDVNPFIYDDNTNGIYSDDNPNVYNLDEFYPPNISSNVINTGNRIGDIILLSPAQLEQHGLNTSKIPGYVFGFWFDKTCLVDECGVFGGDGSTCPKDCSGQICGSKTYDSCGVCGGDGSTCGGGCNTHIDQCGVCGGNGQSCVDCAGVPWGNAEVDPCGVCGGDGTSCEVCEETPFGEKRVDRCGVCGGDGTSCLDCSGVPNGGATVDECGICGGEGRDDRDCCPGDTTNPQGQLCCDDGSAKDVCGECGGNGKDCLDCAGVPFGNKKIDECGECGGDGTSCINCNSTDIIETQFVLDGTGLEQRLLLKKATSKLKRAAKESEKVTRFIDKILAQGHGLYIDNWEFIWSIPSIVKQCESATQCVTTSNVAVIEGYRNNARTFFKLHKKVVRRLKAVTGKANAGRRFLRRGRALVKKSNTLLKNIPMTADVCA